MATYTVSVHDSRTGKATRRDRGPGQPLRLRPGDGRRLHRADRPRRLPGRPLGDSGHGYREGDKTRPFTAAEGSAMDSALKQRMAELRKQL